MISGAENAMEALQKTLKSWLLSIGQWLLKQAIIIPITAQLFGVSEKSIGGGLLGAMAGSQDTGVKQVVDAVNAVGGETQKATGAIESVEKKIGRAQV
jgi:hypothetical protein